MHYIGNLFGNVAGKYLPLDMTSLQVDKIEKQRDELFAILKELVCDENITFNTSAIEGGVPSNLGLDEWGDRAILLIKQIEADK